jgi:hypothetical protein
MSLSEFWAYIRYFYAIADTADLRLTQPFVGLDAHQKTILSDDFGMGIPIRWLIDPLSLTAWCDGREFAERFSALTLAQPAVPARRGPRKSPDFVFLDQVGRFHVVECKGTQSGSASRSRQLSHVNAQGEASGAVVQKMMIMLQPQFQGQRLACGLTIAAENGRGATDLKIQDPESKTKVFVDAGQEGYAQDPVLRSSIARSLRAAGLSDAASVTASPAGNNPGAHRSANRRKEEVRQANVGDRRRAANADIQRAIEDSVFQLAGQQYVGRKVTIQLPKPLRVDGRSYTRVRVEQGIQRPVLQRIRDDVFNENAISEAAPWVPASIDRIQLTSEGTRADLTMGELFRARLTLVR